MKEEIIEKIHTITMNMIIRPIRETTIVLSCVYNSGFNNFIEQLYNILVHNANNNIVVIYSIRHEVFDNLISSGLSIPHNIFIRNNNLNDNEIINEHKSNYNYIKSKIQFKYFGFMDHTMYFTKPLIPIISHTETLEGTLLPFNIIDQIINDLNSERNINILLQPYLKTLTFEPSFDQQSNISQDICIQPDPSINHSNDIITVTPISHLSPRPLTFEDYNKGYLQLLKQLTIIDPDKISQKEFANIIERLNSNHQIIVIENPNTNKIIASGTIFIEQKFIHNMGLVAHIEDIIVDEKYRNEGLGRILIRTLTDIAKSKSCYKITLYCVDTNIKFYEKNGYIKKGYQMTLYT